MTMKIPVTLGFDYQHPIGEIELYDAELPAGIPKDVVFAIAYEEREGGEHAVVGLGMTTDRQYLGFLLNEVKLTTEEAAHVIEKLSGLIKENERSRKNKPTQQQ
jgi:hypothetical protein